MSAPRSTAVRRTIATARTSSAPIQLKSRPKTVAREPLFAIDGVDYTMPVTVELGDSIQLASLLRIQDNEDMRGYVLLRELCGAEAVNALFGDATMTRTDWAQIIKVLTERAFGTAEQEDEGEGN